MSTMMQIQKGITTDQGKEAYQLLNLMPKL